MKVSKLGRFKPVDLSKFLLCATLLLAIFFAPNQNIKAQDLSGSWSIDLSIAANPYATHSWMLAQVMISNVVSIRGSGSDTSASFSITGTYIGTEVNFLYSYPNSNFIIAFYGNITDDNSMSGEWVDSNAQTGTWQGLRQPVTIVPVTPSYKIKDPPAVIVNLKSAILLLEKFSGVAAKAKVVKTSLRYVVEIKRTKDETGKSIKNELIKKITKKNQLALNNLRPGSYSAKYKVELVKKQNGREVVSGQTKFSPTAVFDIIN